VYWACATGCRLAYAGYGFLVSTRPCGSIRCVNQVFGNKPKPTKSGLMAELAALKERVKVLEQLEKKAR
jgi:hypothetical protein